MNSLAANYLVFDATSSGRLCLMLLHSLWQVALLAVLAWLVARTMKLSVERSYTLHVAALLVALAALPVTYALLSSPVAETTAPVAFVEPVAELPNLPEPLPTADPGIDLPAAAPVPADTGVLQSAATPIDAVDEPESPTWIVLAPWIALCYAIGVAIMLLRLAVGSLKANRHCRLAVPIVAGPLVELVARVSREWGLRARCRLAQSAEVVVPQVVGLVKPTILLPASVLSGLAPRDLEMILVHELAHIRRHDVWVNFLQRLAEAVLFFNPGLWYLSRRIGTLREYCCDELACRDMPGDTLPPRVAYATALLNVVELARPGARTPELGALAASGRGPSELRRRVARLFGEPLREPLRLSRGGVLAAVGMAVVLVVGPAWMGSRAQSPAEENQEVEEELVGPVLRGRVTDEQGKPLPGVKVVLYGGTGTRFRGQATSTNDNGEYEFAPLTTGLVSRSRGEPIAMLVGVVFEHDTHVPADGVSWRDISINLEEGDGTIETLDLKMVPGGRVVGTVNNAGTGKPMPKLSLRLYNGAGGDEKATFHAYAFTDESGNFTSQPLYPGQYIVDINDNDFEGDRKYPKIGLVEVKAGETTTVELTTADLPQLLDPFSITGTAKGADGKSMVYGGVGVRLVGSGAKIRGDGGGIDGRDVFNLRFGTVERGEVTEISPYGIGTHDVELVGNNSRYGYRLASRTPSEPLRITDDPTKPDVEDGIRYIRPGEEVEFELVFEKVPEREAEESESSEAESPEINGITIIGDKFVVAPVTTPLERDLMGNIGRAADVTTALLVNNNQFPAEGAIDPQGEVWQELTDRLKSAGAKGEDGLYVRLVDTQRDNVTIEQRRARHTALEKVIEKLGKEAGFARVHTSHHYGSGRRNWHNTIEEAQRKAKEDGTGGLPLVDTEQLKVTLVSTFLAHMLVDADCVVDWLPVVRDADGARLMADVLPAVAEAVDKAETGGGETLLIRLRFSETEKASLERWANDIPGRKAYARGLGFELCNLSQSQIAKEDEETQQRPKAQEEEASAPTGDPDKIAALEELVDSHQQIVDALELRHQQGEEPLANVMAARIALHRAQAERAEAEGNLSEAIDHLKSAAKVAEENVAVQERAFEAAEVTEGMVNEARYGRAAIEVELAELQALVKQQQGEEKTKTEANAVPDPDQIAALEELVKSYDEIHDNIKSLYEAKARGGSADRLHSSHLALLMAKGELETAKGNFTAAVDHYKAAVEAANENVAAHQQAYEAGTITLDGMLEANRKRAEAKVALSRARKRLPLQETQGANAQEQKFLVRVVGPEGKPIAGAKVRQNHVHFPPGAKNFEIKNHIYDTDAKGEAVVTWAGESEDLRIWVVADGYVPLHAMWSNQLQTDPEIPDEFDFKLQKGTEIGGRVVDDQGQPVVGAKVELMDATAIHPAVVGPGRRPVRAHWLAEGDTALITDEQGRWVARNVPPDELLKYEARELFQTAPLMPIRIRVSHPEFETYDPWEARQYVEIPSLRDLRSKTAVVALKGNTHQDEGEKLTPAPR